MPRPVKVDLGAAEQDLGELHGRFGRTVLLIYLGAAAIAVGLFLAAALTDMSHEEATARDTLLLDTETRSHNFSRELGLLAGELRRLGLRSEVDLLDENMEPEQSLLRLSHEKSAFFNVGVAIIGRDGNVLWSLPSQFLPVGKSLAAESWFAAVQNARDVEIVPVSPELESDSLVYLVTPVIRNGRFSGALVGGIDLAQGGELAAETSYAKNILAVLATRDGTVVYPAKPPEFSNSPEWRGLIPVYANEPFVHTVVLNGKRHVVAGDPVTVGDLVFTSVVEEDRLDAPAHHRLWLRLAVGAVMALVPLALLVFFLRRTLVRFAVAQEAAARGARLKLLG